MRAWRLALVAAVALAQPARGAELEARVQISKAEVMLHEQVLLRVEVTHPLWARPRWEPPVFEGFWSERLSSVGGPLEKPDGSEAFERLAALKREVVRHEQRMAELERERLVIHQEQQRIRDNLGRIPTGSDLHRRYLRKLDAQEDKLETILETFDQARRRQIEAGRKLEDYIKTLKI